MTFSTALKPSPKSGHKSRFLTIGYGNEQQSDDTVGPIVAGMVTSWKPPSTHSISVAVILSITARAGAYTETVKA